MLVLDCKQTLRKNAQLATRPGEKTMIETHESYNISFVSFWKSELNVALNLCVLFKIFTRKVTSLYGRFVQSERQTFITTYRRFIGIIKSL